MIALPRLAARIFDEPLAITPDKLNLIVSVFTAKLKGLDVKAAWDDDEDDDQDTDGDAGYQVVDGIATIDIAGTLIRKASGMSALSGLTSYADIAANFVRAMEDPTVQGVMLSIDSPGGEVSGMLDLCDLMYGYRGQKPVSAFVDCAASAAYALASTADYIVTSRTGLTGSVGVIALHRDQSASDEEQGLKYTAIYAGDRKNDGNPHEPLTPEAKSSLQGRIDHIYGLFTASVARNRGMADSAVRGTQASVYTGQQGVDAGLADSVGGPDDALAMLMGAVANGDKSIYASTAASAANSKKEKLNMLEKNAADAARAAEAEKLNAAVVAAKADVHLIADLCALAGRPDLIAGFIASGKPIADVRKELIAEKAAGQTEVDPTVPLRAPGKPGVEGLGKAKPWSDIMSALGVKK